MRCLMQQKESKEKATMETTAVLELRAGEGGTDSCLFLRDMTRMYTAYCASINVGMECL